MESLQGDMGFDPIQHEQIRDDMRQGLLGLSKNRLALSSQIEDVNPGDVAAAAQELGYGVRGACPSPITGAEGNREFFLHLTPAAPARAPDELEALLRKAVVS